MADESRLAALEERVRQLEDHVAVMQLIAPYGARVDGGAVDAAGRIWTDDGDGFRTARVAANRWDVERIDGRWQVRVRHNRLLDGSAESKQILADGLVHAQRAAGIA